MADSRSTRGRFLAGLLGSPPPGVLHVSVRGERGRTGHVPWYDLARRSSASSRRSTSRIRYASLSELTSKQPGTDFSPPGADRGFSSKGCAALPARRFSTHPRFSSRSRCSGGPAREFARARYHCRAWAFTWCGFERDSRHRDQIIATVVWYTFFSPGSLRRRLDLFYRNRDGVMGNTAAGRPRSRSWLVLVRIDLRNIVVDVMTGAR